MKNTLIICATILLLVGGISYLFYLEDKQDTLYDKCREDCGWIKYDQPAKIECRENCKELIDCKKREIVYFHPYVFREAEDE